jgi:hypothetical protein
VVLGAVLCKNIVYGSQEEFLQFNLLLTICFMTYIQSDRTTRVSSFLNLVICIIKTRELYFLPFFLSFFLSLLCSIDFICWIVNLFMKLGSFLCFILWLIAYDPITVS